MKPELTDQECQAIQKALFSEKEYENLALLFKAFSDATRLRIFTVLATQEVCVDDLRNILEMSQSAVSHQLALLRHQNLVKVRKEGKRAYYSLSDQHVMDIFKQALDHVRE